MTEKQCTGEPPEQPLDFIEIEPGAMIERAELFYQDIRRRRTVRDFSNRPVPREIIEKAVLAAGTAPSGANRQPWQFVVVSDPAMKQKIRLAAEERERDFYLKSAPKEWLDALKPMGTNAEKPFLENAPYLIAIFIKMTDVGRDGAKQRTYYPSRSVGIATGMLITALHTAGLATLTYTPSPMAFLNEILGRPKHEHPFLVLVTGYPAEAAQVPSIDKRSLDEIATFLDSAEEENAGS